MKYFSDFTKTITLVRFEFFTRLKIRIIKDIVSYLLRCMRFSRHKKYILLFICLIRWRHIFPAGAYNV